MNTVDKIIVKRDLGLPAVYKNKAENLLRNTGRIWDENFSLVINNEAIAGSDIRVILGYHFQHPLDPFPIGYREFLLYLEEKGIHELKPPGQLATAVVSKKWFTLGRKKPTGSKKSL